jgi:transposase
MNQSGKATHIEVRDIDHLGIVAGIIDDAGVVEEIDRRLDVHPQERLSCGQAVKAMILNGLGFLSAPLYLFEEFFAGKATEHLIGPGTKPEHLNDDRLGRVLDKLFESGLTELFVSVASKASERFGVPTTSTSSVHLDATSFHLHGRYGGPDDDEGEPEEICLTYGYSRDQRPDLKQFVVDLMSSGDGGIPLFLRVADGNDSDQAVFADLIKDFRARVDLDVLFVADSALYAAENLASLGRLRWLCRVPRTLGEARRVLEETPREAFVQSASHEGYRFARTTSDYGGVEQRWLVVHSEDLEQAARERLEKRLRQRERELNAELRRLVGGSKKKTFACQADALEAAEAFAAEHLRGKHHRFVADPPEIVEVRYYGTDRLMNLATYGCRNAERSSWRLRRYTRFSEAASHWPRTRVRGILLPPRSTQEGEHHELEQAGARPADPRLGSIGAALRVARAETLRGDPPVGALRRLRGREGRGGRSFAESTLYRRLGGFEAEGMESLFASETARKRKLPPAVGRLRPGTSRPSTCPSTSTR